MAASGDQEQARRRHPLLTEPHDQPPGEEARREHGEDVPLDRERRAFRRQAAADHRERRGRHQEAHQPVGDQARHHRDDEARLRDDLPQGRPPPSFDRVTTGGARRNETTTIAMSASAACPRKAPANGRPPIMSCVQITVWGPMIPAAMPPLMTQRDGAGPEAFRGRVGGGEAVALHEGRVETGHEGRRDRR